MSFMDAYLLDVAEAVSRETHRSIAVPNLCLFRLAAYPLSGCAL